MATQTNPSAREHAERGYRPSKRERAALRLLSEQTAMPSDQLARFLACSPSKAEMAIDRLCEAGCANSRLYFAGESRWVWLTEKGSSLSRTGMAARVYPPNAAYLNHFRAINEVRLHLAEREPAGRWICETQIQGLRPKGERVPDALFEIAGERHAIEVELSPKSKKLYARVLTENSARYDAVVYFCSPEVAKVLRRIKREGDWSKLIVRDLPNFTPRRKGPQGKARRAPDAEESPIMLLIAEQGAVRIDQLERFISRPAGETEQIAARLCADNLARRMKLMHDEPEWVLLTPSGARLCGSPLRNFYPGRGGVEDWRLANELRLYLAEVAPDARWVSKRTLRKERGRVAAIPDAEAQLDGARFALNIRSGRGNLAAIVARTDRQNYEYDAVVFLCLTHITRVNLEHLQDQHRWSKVVICDMPKPGSVAVRPSAAEALLDAVLGAK